MTTDHMPPGGRTPSRGVSVAVTLALVSGWITIRLVGIHQTILPISYIIPLLVCVWTRDRIALWSMAAIFAAFHTVELFVVLPAGALPPAADWATYGATLVNIGVAALIVHGIIGLRERLERALYGVRMQSEELGAQREQLAQRNEELARQTEELKRQSDELKRQSDELASQNEELQSQAEELSTITETLGRRETLLQALLETARLSGSERTALETISSAAFDLFGDVGTAVAVYERTSDGTRLRALSAGGAPLPVDESAPAPPDAFVTLVLRQDRTACLNDATLRPDLALPAFPGQPPLLAALCAPIRFGGTTYGACAIYSAARHEWTDEEFRLADWLAAQCGRVLQALRVQSDLREADRRKSEFLAMLSHELRNPLAPIRYALRLLESESGRDGHAVQVIERQVQQLVRLVDDLLDATRLARNKIQIRTERIDLLPIVQQTIEGARPEIEAARHTLQVSLPDAPVWLDGDPDRMAQVVANLLNNAIRYTPPGGRVSVAVATTDADVVLTVSDTGVGIAPHDLGRVFDMFTQVGGPGSGGLGIGLALVRNIVELHGGAVEAHSDGSDRGAEFRVRLPMRQDRPAASIDRPAAVGVAASTCRVLVVDDNQDSAEMMGTLLEAHGHEVRVAHDAMQALDLARTFPIDAALLDIGLPGIDGYELARRLRRDTRTSHVRLIALTGWGQETDRAQARDAGFDMHLTKPGDPDIILAAIGGAGVSGGR